MPKYLEVREVAALLGLHPQTIYRKVNRGEIPVVRVGKTLRFDSETILPPPHSSKTLASWVPTQLPGFLSGLFWDVDFARLKPRDKIVWERILELGDLGAVQWLLEHVPLEMIQIWLNQTGKRRLSAKSMSFWKEYFHGNVESKNFDSGAEKTLGQTKWR